MSRPASGFLLGLSTEKLLQSKQQSGRPKDLEFLRAFEARASEDEDG